MALEFESCRKCGQRVNALSFAKLLWTWRFPTFSKICFTFNLIKANVVTVTPLPASRMATVRMTEEERASKKQALHLKLLTNGCLSSVLIDSGSGVSLVNCLLLKSLGFSV